MRNGAYVRLFCEGGISLLRSAEGVRPGRWRHRSLGSQWANIGFNDIWQLVINTGATIITFLMVFLIHKSSIGTLGEPGEA